MKRFIILLLTAVIGALSLSSCATMLPSRFETFSSNVENNSDNYTLRKWERKNQKFGRLCGEYKDNFVRYSASDRHRINSSMASYVKSAAKSGVTTVTDAVTELTGQFNDLINEAKELFDNLGIGKKKTE